MKRWFTLPLLLLPLVAHAQLAVVDISAITQALTTYRTILQGYLEQLRQTQQGYDQIKNQLQQIQYAYNQVQQGLENLKSLNLNNASGLFSLGQQLQDKLRQAEYIEYNTTRAYGQAQSLYKKASGVMTGQDLRSLQRQWAGVQREAGQVGVSVQAIREQQATLMTQQRDLLNKAAAAHGNKDLLQVQAQLQGLQIQHAMSIEDQLVTMGRDQSVKTLEEAVMKEATANALEQASATVTITAQPAGKLLPLSK